MLDLQNLREQGRGAGRRWRVFFFSPSLPPSFPFPFRLIPSPLVALSTLPNLPLLSKSQMADIAFARPQNTPALQANVREQRFLSVTQQEISVTQSSTFHQAIQRADINHPENAEVAVDMLLTGIPVHRSEGNLAMLVENGSFYSCSQIKTSNSGSCGVWSCIRGRIQERVYSKLHREQETTDVRI